MAQQRTIGIAHGCSRGDDHGAVFHAARSGPCALRGQQGHGHLISGLRCQTPELRPVDHRYVRTPVALAQQLHRGAFGSTPMRDHKSPVR